LNGQSKRLGALLIGVVVSVAVLLSPPAYGQVDPYTGATVTPGQPCPQPTLSVTPSGYVEANAPITLTTAGQAANSPVDFYVNGTRVASTTTDGAGRASAATTAPADMSRFDVVVAGVCGTVSATIRSGEVNPSLLDNVFPRGLARTGFSLLPWLIAALLCILVGRKLLRASRGSRRRGPTSPPSRPSPLSPADAR
jgi:hypothetical protein